MALIITLKNRPPFFFAVVLTAVIICLFAGCGYNVISLNEDAQVVQSPDPNFPKAIVVYDSWSGNTALVAEVIAEQLAAPAVSVAQTADYDLTDFDLIVVGSPVHGGSPTAKIKDFLADLDAPRISAVFVTFGAPLFGPMTANACLNKMEKYLPGTSLGRFKCHGFHKILRTYPSHPDEKDAEEAKRFAIELLKRCRSGNHSGSPATEDGQGNSRKLSE